MTPSTTPSGSGRSPRSSRSSTSIASSSRSSRLPAAPEWVAGDLRPRRRRRAGAVERRRASLTESTAPLAISHQGQFPAVTLSFNLAPGVALGQAVTAVEAATRQLGLPASIQGSFQGTAAGLPGVAGERALADPGGAGGRLHRARGALRELHPPDHDHLHAPVGRGGRHPRAPALPDGAQRHRPHRHHPPDRHREEERHHDDRLRPRGGAAARASPPSRRSTRPACCASGRS